MPYIPLTRGHVTRVDDDIFEAYGHLKWSFQPTGYAQRRSPTGKYIILLHRLVMGAVPGEIVHHLNGDRLDNRICNLQILPSQSVHMRQHGRTRTYRDFPKGVYPCKGAATWRAQIKLNGKAVSLGHFRTIEEASLAFQKAHEEAMREDRIE